MKLELDDREKLKICDDIFDILNHGGEVIIRKRIKSGNILKLRMKTGKSICVSESFSIPLY